MNRSFIILVILLLMAGFVDAATVQIGTGTLGNTPTSYPAVYAGYHLNGREQYIITAQELLDAGGGPGPISSIGFNVSTLNTCGELGNFRISMGHTTRSQFSTTDQFETGLTEHALNPVYTPYIGWNWHPFSSYFMWDGVSNIIVQVSTDMKSLKTFNAASRCSGDSTPRTLQFHHDTVQWRERATGYNNTWRPNMKFSMAGGILPPLPASLLAPDDGATNLSVNTVLSWSAPSGDVTGYYVHFGTDFPAPLAISLPADSLFYRPVLEPGTTYYWQVTPYNNNGEALDCPYWSFSTMPDMLVTSLPFREGFETGNMDMQQVQNWLLQREGTYSRDWIANSSQTSYNRSPRTGDFNATLMYSANAWMMRPVMLEGGVTYDFELYARQDGYDADDAVIGLYWGHSSDFASMNNITIQGVVNGNYQRVYGSFVPDMDGVYWIAINGKVTFNPWYLSIDDIKLSERPNYPILAYEPDLLDFGEVAQHNLYFLTMTVKNAGGGVLNLLDDVAFSIIGDADGAFGLEPSIIEGALGEDESTTFDVMFMPHREGTFNVTLRMLYQGATFDVPVTAYAMPLGLVTLGNGTQNMSMPVNPYYGYTYSQSIYLKTDLYSGIDNPPQRISKLAYYWNGADEAPNTSQWSVYMGHTENQSFASTNGWVPLAGLTNVFNGTINLPATPGWIEVPLPVPFIYNNLNNLVIAVDENQAGYDGNSQFFYCTSAPNSRSIRYYSDTTNPNPESPPSGSLVNGFPNIRILMSNLPTAPEISINPQAWDYGNTVINNTNTKSFTIANQGVGELAIYGVSSNSALFNLGYVSLPAFLGSAEYVQFEVSYHPTSVGTHYGTVTVETSQGTYIIELIGHCIDPTITVFPYEMDFDDPWTGSPAAPNHWKVINADGDSYTWVQGNSYITPTHSQPYAAQGMGANYDYLISPPMNLTGGFGVISWYDKVESASYTNSYHVLASETTSDPSSFVYMLDNVTCSNTNWTKHTVDVSHLKDKTIYVAFRIYNSQASNYGFGIDDFMVDLIPDHPILDCLTNVLDTGITPVGTPSAYKEIKITNLGAGFVDLSPANVDITGPDASQFEYLPTALPVSVFYHNMFGIPVRHNPSSAGIHEATFVITYGTTVFEVPLHGIAVGVGDFYESFETVTFPPLGWTDLYETWSQTNVHAYDGNWSALSEPYGIDNWLITPRLEVTTQNHLFTFKYLDKNPDFKATHTKNPAIDMLANQTGIHRESTVDYRELMVSSSVIDPDIFMANVVWHNDVIALPNDWESATVDLSAYIGQSVYLAFRSYHTSTARFYLDQIAGLRLFPETPHAAGLVSPANFATMQPLRPTFVWAAPLSGGVPYGYRLYCDTNNPPTTLIKDANTLTHAMEDFLQPGNTYYWAVEAYNSAGSATSPVFRFDTVPPGLVIVGTGTDVINLPVDPYWGFSYSQSIYLYTELMGAFEIRESTTPPLPAPIQRIAYYWDGRNPGNNSNLWTVYMGHTSQTTLGVTSGWIPASELTQVFSGTVGLSVNPGWVEIELDEPFLYTRGYNLVIAVDENKPGYDTSGLGFHATPTPEPRSISYRSDTINPDPIAPPAVTAMNYFPNLRLQFGELSTNSLPTITMPQSFAFIRNSTFDVDFAPFIQDVDTPHAQLSITLEHIWGTNLIQYQYLPINTPATPGQFLVRFSSAYQAFHRQGFRLKVRDLISGYTVTQEFEMDLLELFDVNFGLVEDVQFTGQTAQFRDYTIGNPNYWLWEFGDGTTSTLKNPSHTYTLAGTYNVKLTLGHSTAGVENFLLMPGYITMQGTAVVPDNLPDNWGIGGSPYNFFGEITFGEDDDLTIDPGVEMNFFGSAPLVILGSMNATQVTFRSQQPGQRWGGLRFGGSSGRTQSVLDHCEIYEANTPVDIEGSSPQFTHLTIAASESVVRTDSPAIRISGDSSATFVGVNIEDFERGILIQNEGGIRSTPTLTNIRIRNSSQTSRELGESGYGVKVSGGADLEDVIVDGFGTGVVIDGSQHATTPTLTNIRIRNSSQTSREPKQGMLILDAAPTLIDVEIEDVAQGLFIERSPGSTPTRTTPTLTNIRIRNSSQTSRMIEEPASTGLKVSGGAGIEDLEVEGFDTGVLIDGSQYATTPTLTNIRIRNSSQTSRTENRALVIMGAAAPMISDLEIEDVQNGIYMNGGGDANRNTPTLTNIRIRNSSQTSRNPGSAIQLVDAAGFILDDAELEGFETGIKISAQQRTVSTPTLTNIRIRNSSQTSRQPDTGIDIYGSVVATMDNILIEEYNNGIKYYATQEQRTVSTPTLTNIRIRNSSQTSRTLGTGISIRGLERITCQNDSIGGYRIGLEVLNDDQRTTSTPTLTNIRIRNSSQTSRQGNIGIKLGAGVGGILKNSVVEEAKTGVFAEEGNTTTINPLRLFNCGVGLQLENNATDTPVKKHLVVLDPSFAALHPQWDYAAFKLLYPGNWKIQNNTIVGYPTWVHAENSHLYFRSNIAYSAQGTPTPFVLHNSLLDTSYNDLNSSVPIPGIGNISQPPLFMNAAERDYTLHWNSPCIDTGSPELPLDGDDTRADMGAYPYLHKVSMTASQRFVSPGTTVYFTNNSLGHDHPISICEWDLGMDGQIDSTSRDWSHQFNSAGVYDVSLRMASGNLNDLREYRAIVVVQDPALQPPVGLSLAIEGENVMLSWQPVTLTQAGEPTTVEYYIVYSSPGIDGYYDFAGYTDNYQTVFAHTDAASARQRFYCVLGFNGSLRELQHFISENPRMRIPAGETLNPRSKP